MDGASSSDAWGLGFEPRPLRLKKIPLLYPETLEVPIRGQVQLWILELGDEAGEKQKKCIVKTFWEFQNEVSHAMPARSFQNPFTVD